MTTNRQILANRQNSRKSTGPKSQYGKANSKMNAMTHGLLAADLVVRDEDPAEFSRFLENLVEGLQPQGPLEENLVERVAACMWRLRRIYRVEAGIFTHESLTIELNRAKKEVKSFEKDEDERMSVLIKNVHITDEEQHGRASTRGQNAARLLQEESLALGAAFKQDAKSTGAFSKLSRYEAAIERSLYRALRELQRIQAARQDGQSPHSIAVDITVDGPGPVLDGED